MDFLKWLWAPNLVSGNHNLRNCSLEDPVPHSMTLISFLIGIYNSIGLFASLPDFLGY